MQFIRQYWTVFVAVPAAVALFYADHNVGWLLLLGLFLLYPLVATGLSFYDYIMSDCV